MESRILEGVVTAFSSISHNGGQSFGVNSKFRREKFVQPDLSVEEVPVISGNGIRGLLRDIGMLHMCRAIGYGEPDAAGIPRGLSQQAFYFLFSGGTLTSQAGRGLDIDLARQLRRAIPLVSLFGGAVGNQILPGRLSVGKMIPICAETAHVIPQRFLRSMQAKAVDAYRLVPGVELTREAVAFGLLGAEGLAHTVDEWDVDALALDAWFTGINGYRLQKEMFVYEFARRLARSSAYAHLTEAVKAVDYQLPSVWEFLQEEMYTRKDDEKNEHLRTMIEPQVRGLLDDARRAKQAKLDTGAADVSDGSQHQQMQYFVETLAAGTPMYWELVVADAEPIEFDALLTTIAEFSKHPFVGGKSGTGLGKIAMKADKWFELTPNLDHVETTAIGAPLGSLYADHLAREAGAIRKTLDSMR